MSALFNQRKNQTPEDWKEKYQSIVKELDGKEKEWNNRFKQQNKSILGLAFSHAGEDTELDQELITLKESLKKEKDIASSIETVVNKVLALTKQKDTSRKKTGPQTQALIAFLEKTRLDKAHQKELELILGKLKKAADDASIDKYIDQLCEIFTEIQAQAPEPADKEPTIEIKQLDTFTEFLNSLSLPGEAGTEIMQLRKRARAVEEQKQRLELVSETISLLSRCYKPGGNQEQLLLQLLDWISLPKTVENGLKNIKDKLLGNLDDKDIVQILKDIANVIGQAYANLQTELDEIQNYLTNVLERLKDLETYFQETQEENNQSMRDAVSLNAEVQDQVHKLQSEMDTDTDIESIKSTIDSHLQFIQTKLDVYLKSEKNRCTASEHRIAELNERLLKMHKNTEELRAAIKDERAKAHVDALTNVPNRLSFDKRMELEYSRWQRYQQALSMAIIDIDNFKGVNDGYGHKAGDKVLKTVAEVCSKYIREIDFFARYGGEEFVVLLPNTNLEDAKIAAEHLRKEVDKCNFHYEGQPVPISVSIGIAEFRGHDDPESIFERADKALYAAKNSGKNCCITDQETS